MNGEFDFAHMLFVDAKHFCASAVVVGFKINVSFRAGFRTKKDDEETLLVRA